MEAVTGELYSAQNRSTLVYGTLMLAADKPYTEIPNLAKVKRMGEKIWQSGKMKLSELL